MSQPPHTFAPEDLAEARRRFEARKLTSDGRIWPVRRCEMRHGQTIRDRMVEDLRARLHDGTASYLAILHALSEVGWTVDQANAHADAAIAAWRDQIVRASP